MKKKSLFHIVPMTSGIVLFVVAGVFFVIRDATDLETQAWDLRPATLTEARVRSWNPPPEDNVGPFYEPVIRYRYSSGESVFEGNGYYLNQGRWQSSSRSRVERMVRDLEAEQERRGHIFIRVNPVFPNESVLVPSGFRFSLFFYSCGVGLMKIGVIVFIATQRGRWLCKVLMLVSLIGLFAGFGIFFS